MKYYNLDSTNLFLLEENEKHEIKTIGKVSGLCIIAYIVIQELISLPIAFPINDFFKKINSIYYSEDAFQYAVVIIMSIFGVLLPFFVAGNILKKKTGTDSFKLNKPISTETTVYVICFGILVCLIGNYVTSWFVTLMGNSGIRLSAPDLQPPSDILGRIVYTISVAIVPALCEELAIRGTVMQPLRKYGDKFAIITSAFVFAVLHGNFVQAPFAFIAGLGIGYAVCITGSLWTGIIIHFINNLYSVIIEFIISDISDDLLLNKIYLIILITLIIIGVIGSVMLIFDRNKKKLYLGNSVLSPSSKACAVLFNLPMIVAILIMLYITKEFIKFN